MGVFDGIPSRWSPWGDGMQPGKPILRHATHESTAADPDRQRRRRKGFAAASLAGTFACSIALMLASVPASGDPGSSVPDPGSRPTALGQVVMPGTGGISTTIPPAGSTPLSPAGVDPVTSQILEKRRAVEGLGERLKQADQEVKDSSVSATRTERALQDANNTLLGLQNKSNSASADAYKHAARLGPFDSYASQLRQLSKVAPGLGDQPGGEALARDLLRAESDYRSAYQAHKQLSEALRNAITRRDQLKSEYDKQSGELAALERSYTGTPQQIETIRDRYEQSLGSGNLGETNIDGMGANERALKAVAYALAQQGKPYEWGATGPSSYDCSGLTWASLYYGADYKTLPRIANDQYRATPSIASKRVAQGDLLVPGDLLFFSPDPNNWTLIHHVGIYIGSGRMIHAPTTGDVVKISPVWWSEFFGATRIFPAVPAPKPSPSTTPKPGTSATSTSPSPSPSTPHSPSVPPSSTSPSRSPETSSSSSSSPSTSSSPAPTQSGGSASSSGASGAVAR